MKYSDIKNIDKQIDTLKELIISSEKKIIELREERHNQISNTLKEMGEKGISLHFKDALVKDINVDQKKYDQANFIEFLNLLNLYRDHYKTTYSITGLPILDDSFNKGLINNIRNVICSSDEFIMDGVHDMNKLSEKTLNVTCMKKLKQVNINNSYGDITFLLRFDTNEVDFYINLDGQSPLNINFVNIMDKVNLFIGDGMYTIRTVKHLNLQNVNGEIKYKIKHPFK